MQTENEEKETIIHIAVTHNKMSTLRYLIGTPQLFRLFKPLPPNKPLQLSSGTIDQAQLSLSVSQRMKNSNDETIYQEANEPKNILTLKDGLGNTILHKLVEMNQLNTIKWILSKAAQ